MKYILGLGLIGIYFMPVRSDISLNHVIVSCTFILGLCILELKGKNK